MNIRKIYLDHSLSEVLFSEGKEHRLVAKLQQLLAVRGLYRGPVHQRYDDQTQEAVLQFQESEGLPATGIAAPLTYCHLCQSNIIELKTSEQKSNRVDFSLPRSNILITKSQRQLTLFDGNNPLHQYPIGIGKPATPTPAGNYSIAAKVLNPGGMLGTRWLGLNYDTYGIHGTNAP